MTFSDIFHVALMRGCLPLRAKDMRAETRTDTTGSKTPDGRLRLR